MNRILRSLGIFYSLLLVTGFSSAGAVPPLLNFQGRLSDSNGGPLTGDFTLTFRIHDAEINGQELWLEMQNVTVADGLFGALLGSLTPFPQTLFKADDRWLGISVGADPELQPRRRIVTAAFAYQSLYADSAELAMSISPNAVTSAAILDGTIQNSDLAIESINSQSIQDFSITGTDIVGGTITGDKIAGNAINSARIVDGSIVGIDIAASQITTSHVVNGTLLGADLVDGAITGSKIADGSVSNVDLIPNSVTANEIQDGSLLGADLADASITSIKIFDGTVNSNDIGPNAVGTSEIAPNAVSAAKISDEPGIAQILLDQVNDIVLDDTVAENLVSRSINCPSDGYVLAMATCRASYSLLGGGGVGVSARFGLSTTSATFPSQVVPNAYVSGTVTVPVACNRVFNFSAGSHTVYFVGSDTVPGHATEVNDIALTLLFIPTAYGTVSGADPD